MTKLIDCAAMFKRIVLIASLGLWATQSACAQAEPTSSQSGATNVTVSSAEELEDALKTIEGPASILLAPGRYPIVILRDITADNVEITSADARNPALLAGLYLRNVSGLKVSNLALSRHVDDPRFINYLLWVLSSSDVEIRNFTFQGVDGKIDPEIRAAAMLRASRNIDFTGNSFSHFVHGLELLDLENITIRNNEFTHMQTDAIRGGGVSNILIANNVMTEFYPAEGDHPDGIQLWSTNQPRPGRNIAIRENLVVKGDGGYVQGIFIRDTHKQMPFEDVEITDNLVVGTLWNGISLDGVNRALIQGNKVLADPAQRSWIRLDLASDVDLRGNSAELYMVRFERGQIRRSNNKNTAGNYRRRNAEIREWVASRPGFADHHGRVLSSLMAAP